MENLLFCSIIVFHLKSLLHHRWLNVKETNFCPLTVGKMLNCAFAIHLAAALEFTHLVIVSVL